MYSTSTQQRHCTIQSNGKKLTGFAKFKMALEVYRQRQRMLKLTMDELRDMGIHQGDLLQEARRGFWDIDC